MWDLPRLAACLPGCERIEAVGEGAYKTRMTQRVGPFRVSMDMDLTLVEAVDGQRVDLSGVGSDGRGNRLKLERLRMELKPLAPDETEVSYELVFNLMGRLGSLGNAVVKRKAEEIRAEFTERISRALAAS